MALEWSKIQVEVCRRHVWYKLKEYHLVEIRVVYPNEGSTFMEWDQKRITTWICDKLEESFNEITGTDPLCQIHAHYSWGLGQVVKFGFRNRADAMVFKLEIPT